MSEIIITHPSGRRVRQEFIPWPEWETIDQIVSLIISEGMFTRGTVAEVHSFARDIPFTVVVNSELH